MITYLTQSRVSENLLIKQSSMKMSKRLLLLKNNRQPRPKNLKEKKKRLKWRLKLKNKMR